MSRDASLLPAPGLLIAAEGSISPRGWALFVRDRHAGRAAHPQHEAAEEH
jgi:hypothetical protein